MRILFVDTYGQSMLFADEDEFLQHCEDDDVDFEYTSYGGQEPEAFYVPEDLVRVNVEKVPSRYRIRPNPDSTEIPAPLSGETVSDYARRISGG